MVLAKDKGELAEAVVYKGTTLPHIVVKRRCRLYENGEHRCSNAVGVGLSDRCTHEDSCIVCLSTTSCRLLYRRRQGQGQR